MPSSLSRPRVCLALALVAALSCQTTFAAPPKGSPEHIAAVTGNIDERAVRSNAARTADWPAYGLDYAETRHSKLAEINAGNVGKLGLAWTYNLESTRGVEATPLVVDGIMYVTASWSVVHAVDVRTGKRLWSYDPKVPREYAQKGCCDVVNRGVALYKGKVFVGTFDGRLVALDAATGKPVWEKDTVEDRSRPYTVTGAPRVIKGKVIIGNGGAEYGVRGYLTAYDAETGEQKWRWYTVPGDPSKPFENEAMAKAAKTWDPAGQWWVTGGGGTAWNSITYDPELNLMYVGTGNGSPWNHRKRSPAGGDNLYLASIVALDPDTGKYVWHYQETPGDNWDYTSVQDMILTDLTLDGRKRKVILHAPKNGFFFVIDRTNGKFISAKPFTEVNWATGYDKHGRPIETPLARSREAFDSVPGPFGGHNWHAMSFNPKTGLAYFPVQNVPINLAEDKDWRFNENKPGQPQSGTGWNTGMLVNTQPPKSKAFGRLVAWDPVKQKEAWRQEYASPWNGGTLTTAGNLVFAGTADGRFAAYSADKGEKLWEAPIGVGMVAPPVTYEVDGRQYVSIAVGWGGVFGQFQRATDKHDLGRVYTFALGAEKPLPVVPAYPLGELISGVKYDPAHISEGTKLYVSNCVFCHGVPGIDKGGNIPNLGYVPSRDIANLSDFVFNGPFVKKGMPDFTGKLSADDVEKIKAFIQGTADAIRPKP